MSNPCPSPENVQGFVVGQDGFKIVDGICKVECFCGALILPQNLEKHKTYTTHKADATEKWARIGKSCGQQRLNQRLNHARQECVDAKNALRSKYERRLTNSDEKYRNMLTKFKDAKHGETALNLAYVSERETSNNLRRDLEDCEERHRQRNPLLGDIREGVPLRQEPPGGDQIRQVVEPPQLRQVEEQPPRRNPLLGAIEGGAQLRQVEEPPPRRNPLLGAIEGGVRLREVGVQPPRQIQQNPLLGAIREGVPLREVGVQRSQKSQRSQNPQENSLQKIIERRSKIHNDDDENDENDDEEWKFGIKRRKSKKSVRKSKKSVRKSVRKTKKSVRKSARKTKKSVIKSVRKSKKSVRKQKK